VSRPPLPAHVAALAAELADLPGPVAVVLGGSRATETHRPDSDWDLGVYYRGSQQPLNPDDLRRLGHDGHVSQLGEWGPIMNGGGWLTIDHDPVACAGMLAQAVLCEAHGRLAQRREWVLNEKNLVRRAGLDDAQQLLATPGATAQRSPKPSRPSAAQWAPSR
jgi:Nucleotidyltransferase domain